MGIEFCSPKMQKNVARWPYLPDGPDGHICPMCPMARLPDGRRPSGKQCGGMISTVFIKIIPCVAFHCNFRALFMFEWQGWSSLAAAGKYQFVVAYWSPELIERIDKCSVNDENLKRMLPSL